jgi:segregation and condensation protein A
MDRRDYEVRIENIFEGPMDLLVHLVKKNEVDIWDIPIAMITDQYMAYLEWMKTMNIEFAGEFILMASTLAQIKSRMLLPVYAEAAGDEDDPRMEIVRPLAEYIQMKSAAESLAARNLLGDAVFPRSPADEDLTVERSDEFIKVGLFELIDAFQRILDRTPDDQPFDLSEDTISIKDRISEIVEVLEARGSVTFDELFPQTAAKGDIITTFLAVLEMVKLCLVRVTQHVQSGVIRLFYL